MGNIGIATQHETPSAEQMRRAIQDSAALAALIRRGFTVEQRGNVVVGKRIKTR